MIVADTSWVVALRDPHDAHHADATAISEATASEDVLLHPVTFAECLVAPARLGVLDEAAAMLRAAYEITPFDDDAPIRWAALRADSGLRLPDVVVLDTALHHGARAVATFDDQLASRARDQGLGVLASNR